MLTWRPEVSRVSESDIHSRVRAFVQEHAMYRQRRFVLPDDSRYVTAIVNFIGQEYGIQVSSYDITEENLGSPRAVARFIARHIGVDKE
jgi:hypothetical protein